MVNNEPSQDTSSANTSSTSTGLLKRVWDYFSSSKASPQQPVKRHKREHTSDSGENGDKNGKSSLGLSAYQKTPPKISTFASTGGDHDGGKKSSVPMTPLDQQQQRYTTPHHKRFHLGSAEPKTNGRHNVKSPLPRRQATSVSVSHSRRSSSSFKSPYRSTGSSVYRRTRVPLSTGPRLYKSKLLSAPANKVANLLTNGSEGEKFKLFDDDLMEEIRVRRQKQQESQKKILKQSQVFGRKPKLSNVSKKLIPSSNQSITSSPQTKPHFQLSTGSNTSIKSGLASPTTMSLSTAGEALCPIFDEDKSVIVRKLPLQIFDGDHESSFREDLDVQYQEIPDDEAIVNVFSLADGFRDYKNKSDAVSDKLPFNFMPASKVQAEKTTSHHLKPLRTGESDSLPSKVKTPETSDVVDIWAKIPTGWKCEVSIIIVNHN